MLNFRVHLGHRPISYEMRINIANIVPIHAAYLWPIKAYAYSMLRICVALWCVIGTIFCTSTSSYAQDKDLLSPNETLKFGVGLDDRVRTIQQFNGDWIVGGDFRS